MFHAQGPALRMRSCSGRLERHAAVGMGLKVRAVFFDLDNTLIDTAGAGRKGMFEVTFRYPRPSSGRCPRVLPSTERFPVPLVYSPVHLTPRLGVPKVLVSHALSLLCRKERERRKPDSLAYVPVYPQAPESWVLEIRPSALGPRKMSLKLPRWQSCHKT